MPAAAAHARVLKAIGLSALLHAAALAGWQPPTLEPPRLARFEPIEVALIGEPAPRRSAAAAVPDAPAAPQRPVPVASHPGSPVAEPAPVPPPDAGEEARSEEPLVEARADVATLHNPKPPYPLAARRRGIEGRVRLAVHVRADGACAEVRVLESSGHRLLDEAALDTVRRWRFLPARRGARAVDSWVEVPIRFQLEG